MQEVINKYGLGEISDKVSVSQGYANENYKLTVGGRTVLYRICKQQPRDLLEYEIRLMKQLKAVNFPTAFPFADKSGNMIQSTFDGNVMLYEFKEGQEPEVNLETATAMGEAIGRLSNIKMSADLKKKNAVHLDNCEMLIREFDQATNQMPEVFGYFVDQTQFLKKTLVDDLNEGDLPFGVVHGDAFPNNTIFEGNQLVAIIDFEEACSDYLMFDVGMTINGFCFVDNQLKFELMEAFLNAYNQQRQLTDLEYLLLPIFIQWGAHGMLSWHLRNNLLYDNNRQQYDRVMELMNRTKYLREHPEIFNSVNFLG